MVSSFTSIIPSIGLFSVLCWPFLVAWLLWVSRRPGHVHSLAIGGAVMTVGALSFFPSRLDVLGKISVGLASFLPLMLFFCIHYRAEIIEREEGKDALIKGERLPFLITGCVLMALSLSSALLASLFIGAGCVLLAWWDGLSPRRAMAAWSMVRLRLCGVILAVLGAALLQSVTGNPSSQIIMSQWGVVFLVIGLGMMAGLGNITGQKPAFALLDSGLRFAALCLMARLGSYPLAHVILLGAGLTGLVFSLFIKERREAFLPFMAALATIAASAQSLMAFMLLMVATIGGMGLGEREGSRRINYAALPLIFAALLLMGQHLSPLYACVLIMLSALNFRSLAHMGFCGFSLHKSHFSSLQSCLVSGLVSGSALGVSLAALAMAKHSFPIGWHP